MQRQEKIRQIKAWLGPGSINVFGMQLSGKDTQCGILAAHLNGVSLSSGNILRNSVVPEDTAAALAAGKLVPSDEFAAIVTPYLGNPEFSGRPLILSSVGRWIGEEQGILEATANADHPIKAAVVLNIDKNTAFERLATAARGRDDDHAANLTVRIQEFLTKTLPVLEVYRNMGLLIEIDGTMSQAAVTDAIIAALYQRTIHEI